ncbi:C39 family peptidase [Bacteroides sp.]
MKKNIIKISLVFLTLLGIASCVQEFINNEDIDTDDFSVKAAKSIFEKQVHTFEVKPFILSAKTRKEGKPAITPLWSKGYHFNDETGNYVEVPLNLPLSKIFARRDPKEAVSDDEKYQNTMVRLLIQKISENDYEYSIVHITGDSLYMSKGKRTLTSLHLNNLSSFSGQIRYFNLKAELLWGKIYKNGAIIGHISLMDESNNSTPNTRGYYTNHCENYPVEYEYCYYTGYEDNEGITITNEDCYTETHWETNCYDIWVSDGDDGGSYNPGGGGASGGSGGGTPTINNPQKYIKADNDKISKKKIPETMTIQIPNMCVPSIMEFVSNFLKGQVNQVLIMQYYYNTYGRSIANDGVSGTHIEDLVNHFFTTSPFEGYKEAIDKGYVVMTDIREGTSTEAHNILVIGYKSNGDLIYMDPAKGYWMETASFYIKGDYKICIKGEKYISN